MSLWSYLVFLRLFCIILHVCFPTGTLPWSQVPGSINYLFGLAKHTIITNFLIKLCILIVYMHLLMYYYFLAHKQSCVNFGWLFCMTMWREVWNHVTSPEVINIIGTPISAPFPDQPPDILELSIFYFVPRSATKILSKQWRLGQSGTHKLVSGGCDYSYKHYTLTKHKQVTFFAFFKGGQFFYFKVRAPLRQGNWTSD